MEKYILLVAVLVLSGVIVGCTIKDNGSGDNATKNGKESIIIDYAEYPENFMIQLESDTEYLLVDGDTQTKMSATMKAKNVKKQVLVWGDASTSLEFPVNYGYSEPVLIHYNNTDYIWIGKKNNEGELYNQYVYYKNEQGEIKSGNSEIKITISDNVLDPADFVLIGYIDCFGHVLKDVHYTINEEGKPVEIENEDSFDYVASSYTQQWFELDEDINTWVYKDENATEYTIETLPQGTKFRRFRVPKNEEYSYSEALLEDGRVMRVVEEYWFSEPEDYQAIMDYDGEQFAYHEVAGE